VRIIIAGAGEVGTHLSKMLSYEGHDLTVIDIEAANLKQLQQHLDLLTVEGSAISLKALEKAKVNGIDLFVAVTHYQEMNIASAVMAKKLGAKQTIARIIDPDFLTTDNQDMFRKMGIDHLVYPQKLAAAEVVNFIKQASTREVFDFADGELSLFVIKLDENAPILNKTLLEAGDMDNALDYRAVAITRDSQTIVPRGNDIFRAGDLIYVVTTKKGINSLLKYTGKKKVEISNIMILGGSRIGRLSAIELENQFNVKLIEINQAKANRLTDKLYNTLIINGDGRNTDLLIEEGIRKMDAFIAVTGNSETNILSCLLAKRLGVKKTIAEVENIDYMELAENVGIDTLINKKIVAASQIYKHTLSAEVSTVKHLTQTEAEVLEFVVKDGAKITRNQLNMTDFPKQAIIGGIVRGRNVFIARGATKIEPKDKVLVFSLPSAIPAVERFFE
jgi:trk system potassium uptake protein